MKHFTEAQFADFVRNLVPPAPLQGHLDECKQCANTLQIWQSVASIAGREKTYVPPDDVLRVAKSGFGLLPAAEKGVRLVFDSMLQPQTAGTRGSATARQFLYETDEYYIDLRLESRAEDRACLVGQVLNRSSVERSAPGLAVLLQAATQEVAKTSTNQFGEFQLEFAIADRLWISIRRSGAKAIVLPLYGINANPLKKKD